jgi:hypothetical protein
MRDVRDPLPRRANSDLAVTAINRLGDLGRERQRELLAGQPAAQASKGLGAARRQGGVSLSNYIMSHE